MFPIQFCTEEESWDIRRTLVFNQQRICWISVSLRTHICIWCINNIGRRRCMNEIEMNEWMNEGWKIKKIIWMNENLNVTRVERQRIVIPCSECIVEWDGNDGKLENVSCMQSIIYTYMLLRWWLLVDDELFLKLLSMVSSPARTREQTNEHQTHILIAFCCPSLLTEYSLSVVAQQFDIENKISYFILC